MVLQDVVRNVGIGNNDSPTLLADFDFIDKVYRVCDHTSAVDENCDAERDFFINAEIVHELQRDQSVLVSGLHHSQVEHEVQDVGRNNLVRVIIIRLLRITQNLDFRSLSFYAFATCVDCLYDYSELCVDVLHFLVEDLRRLLQNQYTLHCALYCDVLALHEVALATKTDLVLARWPVCAEGQAVERHDARTVCVQGLE